MSQVSQWPRIFQANVGRLYERVIAPAMENIPVHEKLVTGRAATMDEFLDRCASQVDNYTANEANKVFALVLIALFERQLRPWAGLVRGGILGPDTRKGSFLSLVDATAKQVGIDLDRYNLGPTIIEAFEVGNVARSD